MKKKFDWDRFISPYNDKVVHCETREEAELFCNLMHEHGLKWEDGELYTDVIEWDKYKQDTCYNSDGLYANLNFYKDNGCEILKFSDYDFTGESEKTILNAEFYKKKIDALGGFFMITRSTNEIKSCSNESCENCIFNNSGESCQISIVKWLISPYEPPEEKIVVSNNVRKFLEVCNPESYIYQDDCFYLFEEEPKKNSQHWDIEEGEFCVISNSLFKGDYIDLGKLDSLKERPLKVKEILNKIKPTFPWEDFLNICKNVCVHCETENEAIDFTRQLLDRDYNNKLKPFYFDNEDTIKKVWNVYKKDSYYTFNGVFKASILEDEYSVLNWADYME